MIYYYRIGKNKYLEYNTAGFFRCPKTLDRVKRYFGNDHSEPKEKGATITKILEEKETPEGKITKTLTYKADKKNPPVCKCGEPMVFRYSVWYEYRDPKAKVVGGLFRMGTKDKRYWTRYFATRKARDKFINRFLEKHRK